MRSARGVGFSPGSELGSEFDSKALRPRVVLSMIQNHVDSTVTAKYDRHKYFNEMRNVLEAWTERLEALTSAGGHQARKSPESTGH